MITIKKRAPYIIAVVIATIMPCILRAQDYSIGNLTVNGVLSAKGYSNLSGKLSVGAPITAYSTYFSVNDTSIGSGNVYNVFKNKRDYNLVVSVSPKYGGFALARSDANGADWEKWRLINGTNDSLKILTNSGSTLALSISQNNKVFIPNRLLAGPVKMEYDYSVLAVSGKLFSAQNVTDTIHPVMSISRSYEGSTIGGNAMIRFDAPFNCYSGIDFGTNPSYLTKMEQVNGLICKHLGSGYRDLRLQANYGDYIYMVRDSVKIAADSSITLTCARVAMNSDLQINGELRIKNWTLRETPDYVFHDNYKLPKLDTIEKFVKEYHHLPEIPNAKTMAEKGMDLVEMNLTLLKKVEELTLYLIDQQKQIKEQQSQINILTEKIDGK